MAVVVQCYHCSNILELDEGFRGGVCRCSQCGSLLQVPKSADTETRKARPAAPGSAETNLQRPAGPPRGSDTGLSRGQFDPRSPRTGPGGSRAGEPAIGSGAFARSPMRPNAPVSAVAQREKTAGARSSIDLHTQAAKAKKNSALLWVGIILAALIGATLLVVVVVLIRNSLREDKHPSSGNTVHNVVNNTNTPAVPTGPHFLTIKLTGKKVVFGLDAGSASMESYSYMTEAVTQAVGTLELDQEFCVVLWKEEGPQRFPASGWTNKSGLTGVKTSIESLGPNGIADALKSMSYCLAVGGDQVILVTAKTDLSKDLAAAVLHARKSGQEIDTIRVMGNVDIGDTDSPLKAISDGANGVYLPVDVTRLKELLHPTAP